MQKIKRNAIKCNICGDIIESKTTHDFQQCKCGRCFIDGGTSYVRAGFEKPEDIEWMTEYEDVPGLYVSYKVIPASESHNFSTFKSVEKIKEDYRLMHELIIMNEDGDILYKRTDEV